MENWIISEICSFFVSSKLSYIQKVKIRYKLIKTKRILKQAIGQNILHVYENEVYYHEFDSYLQGKKFVSRILNDLYKTQICEYKSVDCYTKILIEEFLQRYPQYVIYKGTFIRIIYMIFTYVFNSLNECHDENARIIINNTKELIGELNCQINLIAEQYNALCLDNKKIFDLLSALRNSSIRDNLSIDDESVQTGLELYKNSLKALYWNKNEYIKRTVQGKDDTKVIDVLIENKKIVLLGEPGCGKTTESLIVIEEVCSNNDFKHVIPVFVSLAEYGILYESIREGIQKKLDLFVPNIHIAMINQLLSSNKIFLILDGADEIVSLEKRNKFYFEINDIMKVPDIHVLLTSRRNQYHGNAKNIKEISINNIDRNTIDEKLRKAGIRRKVLKEFYELFQYPLFLEIGISVLGKYKGNLYNKSQLMEEYINLILDRRDREKGIAQVEKNLYETIEIISELAFLYFEKPSFSFVDFDRILADTKFSHANICDLFRLDVFSITSDIRFSHKQFKEYFAAFYLVNHISIFNETEKYRKLMHQEEWQEVLVLACGIYRNIEEQICFLDELVAINLRTYIRCVRLKNDLSPNMDSYSHEEYSRYYLKSLYDTYTTIVNAYFPAIKRHFNPQMGKKSELLSEKKPCIVGELSQNKKHLTYWFDWRDKECPDVLLLDGNGAEEYKNFEHRAIKERRNISIYGIDLERSGYEGDSARAVALERIQGDLNTILEKRLLIEDDAFLCERLAEIKKNVKFIKSSTSINEMYLKVKEYVDETFENVEKGVELVGITYDKVDILNLFDILQKLHSHDAIYEQLIFPKKDKNLNGGLVWEFYSEEQMVKVIERFFYQIVISYQNMVEYNFPRMKGYFYSSMDYPLKYKVRVQFNCGEGYDSQPMILYYYVSTTEDDLFPEIIKAETLDFSMSDDVFNDIIKSYIINGKEAKEITFTNVGVTMCINERFGKFNNCPLAAFVYKQIKNEFKTLFGN